MRFSEMDSFSKLFDRFGRMIQNLKQQAQTVTSDDEMSINNKSDPAMLDNPPANVQFPMQQPQQPQSLLSSSSTGTSVTPSPCQPSYPLHGTLSSQSSLSPQSYAFSSSSTPQQTQQQAQNQHHSSFLQHTGAGHQSMNYCQHQNSQQSSTPHNLQHPLQASAFQSMQQQQQQHSGPSPSHYHHSPGGTMTANTIHGHHQATSNSHPQQYHHHHHSQSSSSGAQHHHHNHHHPILVASSSQPLMPATSPNYAYGAGMGGAGGGVSSSGSAGVMIGSTNSTNNIGLSGGTSTTSNSPSSCSAISPAPAQQSYSAVQTPDSPVGFPRRQLSLTVGQKLHLDLNRKPKNSGSQGSIFVNTNDVINQHSLSPRPRPRNLGLSNSHDNMFKPSRDSGGSSSGGGVGSGSSSGFGSIHHHNGHSGKVNPHSSHQYPSRECLAPLSFNTPTHGLGSKTGHYNPPPPPRTLKDEFAKNNRTIEVNGHKYENIVEKDFRKISELGNGSFGQVEKMLHIPSKVEFAVKKMRRSGNQDDNKHIINDLDLLRKCTNFPHIVQCCGYYIMETEVWIFMELMTICFDRLLKRLTERIPEQIVGKIAVATVEALNYLKVELSIIHRDIKPSNILINREGIIKLCDFGISGRLIDSKAHSRSVGCAAYMAPERIQPDSSGTYDVRSDVWSLGITLVEIATGKFPYQGWKSDFELLSKVIQDAPPTLPIDDGFSEEFQSFITACLMKDYCSRPKYNDLMKNPFFLHYKRDTQVDVSEWFNRAYPADE